ncbi:MAG: hypothetical protein JRN68_08200 [Nitrososphaerota archaeon]|jgi:hypothetical protein|nr:hypothetical protein [Nitrososphaerota archaeon]
MYDELKPCPKCSSTELVRYNVSERVFCTILAKRIDSCIPVKVCVKRFECKKSARATITLI